MSKMTALLASMLVAGSSLAQERGLENLYEPGFVVEDRNGDDFVDFVHSEIVLGDRPGPEAIAAGADIAARLGFETMAMNLPLTGERGGIPIVIEVHGDLAPGEGLVQVDPDRGILVQGGDEAGLRAAAAYLAGRVPRVWAPDGTSLTELLDQAREALAEGGVEASGARAPRALLRAGADELAELSLVLDLPSAADVERAPALLQGSLGHPEVASIVVTLRADGETSEVRIPRGEAEEKAGGPIPARPGGSAKHDLDLSNLYTVEGLLGDSDSNLIADRLDTVLSPADGSYLGTVDLAARLGLESAGISVPLVKRPEEIEEPGGEPTLVLIGAHPRLDELVEDGKIDAALGPGEGLLQIVPEAFGEKGAFVIAGGDAEGVDRALDQVATRLPHLWERGRDRESLDDVEMDLWKFLSGRSPAGQAAIALYKLDRLVERLSSESIASARVLVSVEKPAEGLEALVRERAGALGDSPTEVVLDDRDVQNAATIFEESFELPSEVDEFWRLLRERVLPRVREGEPAVVRARLSEPRDVRRDLEERARAELLAEGARDEGTEVRILSAYKQGFSWLEEVVAPELARAGAREVVIHFARYVPPEEWPQQAMHTPLRWLHEAFPIDEILARELDLELDRIRFEMAPEDAPPYEVVALGPGGEEVFRDAFAPKFVVRPYLDRFRDYEMVRVTTGWLTARVGSETVLDRRIATDPERFWDRYQAETLEAIYRYVMERHEGVPRGEGKDAPLFGELEIEVSMSEPHEMLDVDKEIVSSLDALHEDLYFTTLMFFRILGRNSRGEELTYPGRILPVMRPKDDGTPPQVAIRFTGFATSRPAVVIDYETREGESKTARLDVPRIETSRPSALAARVRSGSEGLERLDVRIKVDTRDDEREELIRIERAEDVDESILSAEQVLATIANLEELRARGLYETALAYRGLRGELRVLAGWTHEVAPETQLEARLPANGSPPPPPAVTDYLDAPFRYTGQEIVQWDTPIPPPEAYALLAKMSTFDEATVYKVGESYLGKEIWAMDLMPPIEASHLSIDKATTFKPTVIYSAREHANEVSSTSHVLKLAELLLTDDEHRKKLDEVNVIVHPITNPDGAQLAYDLYEITPELILHAGYLGSLGIGATSDSSQPMPIYPEATVRPRLWRTWRPDIFLNPHGYPSHQVVQLFSEYTGLVRGGRVTERNWSMNKGWFLPGFNYIDDPRYPRHKEAAFRIRDYITKAINEATDVYEMNQRSYDRYYRYGGRFDEEEFKLPMVDEVMIHTAIKGSRAPSPGSDRGFNPKVTIWSGNTEAPDETAHGEWMKLVATAGLQWDKAILQYLVDGEHEVKRKGSEFWGGVSLSLDRPRPPEPEEEEETQATSGGK